MARGNLGVALVNQGRLQDALPQFRSAVEAAPWYAQAHMNLGNALVLSGKLEDGIEHFRTALELDDRDYRCAFNLGQALVYAGRPREAGQALDEALRRARDPSVDVGERAALESRVETLRRSIDRPRPR